ncbi:HAD family hydrolase [Robiginitalea sediminis]|uniref:HAD family hydrolase n=1 Tax=Robiginitalea sediminis TaxID=1982593 RepID=UPI000B4B8357|nr:HAD family hydrolase [Robiginitalea sediminis]
MDLSHIRMVVADMDGTLLNPAHEVSNRFFDLYHSLRDKGVEFVAASGRQYHSMADKLAPIRDEIVFIAENGALVRWRDQTLMTTPLPSRHVGEILRRASGIRQAHPVLCASSSAYVDGASDDFLTLLQEYYTEYTIAPDLGAVTDPLMKVAIYHWESSEQFIYPAFADMEDTLKVKVSGSNWVDVSHPDAHKGHALEALMAQRGLGRHQIMVFGDYNNDLEMLALSDYSFAMANAHPNVKKVARYETGGNDEGGVEQVLEALLRQV